MDKLFSLINETLHDPNWIVRRDSISFLAEIMPTCGPDVQRQITRLIPALVLNLGDAKVAIKSSTISAVMLSFRFLPDSQAFMELFVNDALENPQARVRTEALHLLTSPLPWEAIQPEETFTLLEAVVGRLRDIDQDVVRAAVQVLQFAPGVIGAAVFEEHLAQLHPSLGKLYPAIMNRVTGTAVSSPTPGSATQRLHSGGGYGGGGPAASSGNGGEAHFGFIPSHLMALMLDKQSWQTREKGIQDVGTLLMSMESVNGMLPFLARLLDFLGQILSDTNLKVRRAT